MFAVMAITNDPKIELPSSLIWPTAVGTMFFMGSALLFWFVAIPFQIGRLYRQNSLLFGETEFTDDAQGIKIKTPRSVWRYNWSDLRGFKEDKQVFQLCLSKSVGYTIPKEGMSPETVNQFRDRCSEKLKRL